MFNKLLNVMKNLGNSKYVTPALNLPHKVQWPGCYST